MAGNNWQRITSIFLIGVGVGATVGVLFAPKSGGETRDQISGAVNDGVDEIVAQGNKLGRRAQKTVENAKGHLRDAAEAGECTRIPRSEKYSFLGKTPGSKKRTAHLRLGTCWLSEGQSRNNLRSSGGAEFGSNDKLE